MALMTLIDDTGYPVAWPCGPSPVSKDRAQRELDEANEYFASVGIYPPYIKGIVPKIDIIDPTWNGIVVPSSPLARLAAQAETQEFEINR